MKIGVLSDSHGYLHPDAYSFFEGCDEIWHAGDIMDDSILDELRSAPHGVSRATLETKQVDYLIEDE